MIRRLIIIKPIIGVVTGVFICAVMAGCAGPRPLVQSTLSPAPTVGATATLSAYPLPGTAVPQPTKVPIIYPTINANETRPPKPTPVPSLTPTLTPIPTALAVPASGSSALWVEIVPDPKSASGAEEPDSILWIADPHDVGTRKALVRFAHQQIREVSISPSGLQMALVSSPKRGTPNALWIANIDGSSLKQLALDASQIRWSPDSANLVYAASLKVEGADGSALDIVDVASSVRTRLQTFEPDLAWHLISWPTAQRQIYIARAQAVNLSPRELWLVGIDTKAARKVADLSDDINQSAMSPDGSKYIGNAPQGLAWHSIDQQSQEVILQPGRGFSAIWSTNNQDLITSEWGTDPNQMVVRAINVTTLVSRTLGAISPPADVRLLALSPDETWLAFDQYNVGLFLMHLPTGLKVAVPSANSPLRFGAWVRN